MSVQEPGGASPQAVYPAVISASRATDVPAFHAAWLMERLRAGHCRWRNPFNAAQTQTVSFAQAKAAVFWSKNPAPLMPHLAEIADMGLKFYFQFTLNDYEAAGLEPGLPPLRERMATFAALAKKCRVVWRYDPLILGGDLSVERHVAIAQRLMTRLGESAAKLVFSFVDMYARTARNFNKFDRRLRAPDLAEMRRFAQGLCEARDAVAPRLRLAACAELDADFSGLDVERGACIDAALINEICGEEIYRERPARRMREQAVLPGAGGGGQKGGASTGKIFPKDRGQRKGCGCAPARDIGSYRNHPCRHGCVYCYAGHAKFR